MATMTSGREATTTRPRRTRIRPRVDVRLVLTIDDRKYEVRAFEDDPRNKSLCEWVHSLKEAGHPKFDVYHLDYTIRSRPDERHRCDRCDRCDCVHIHALARVGLL